MTNLCTFARCKSPDPTKLIELFFAISFFHPYLLPTCSLMHLSFCCIETLSMAHSENNVFKERAITDEGQPEVIMKSKMHIISWLSHGLRLREKLYSPNSSTTTSATFRPRPIEPSRTGHSVAVAFYLFFVLLSAVRFFDHSRIELSENFGPFAFSYLLFPSTQNAFLLCTPFSPHVSEMNFVKGVYNPNSQKSSKKSSSADELKQNKPTSASAPFAVRPSPSSTVDIAVCDGGRLHCRIAVAVSHTRLSALFCLHAAHSLPFL